jgi:NAD(P)-dependent dehydrogenase (short-subunit alcohol dehydrogenase family)
VQSCSGCEKRLQEAYGDSKVRYLVADLASQKDIAGLVRGVQDVLLGWRAQGLDGLVNNAGTFTFWQTLSPEGFETQWAVNHLAPFSLTLQLLPLLEQAPSSKVITVSSGSHYGAVLDWTDLQLFAQYNPLKAYKRSKLAAVMFIAELRRRLGPNSRLQSAVADPGLVNTGMGNKTGSQLAGRIWSRRRRRGISADKSAAGIGQLLLDIDLDHDSPVYWKHGRPKQPNRFALDADSGRRLWMISSRMTGITALEEPLDD